jgi:hypothetical protein
LILSWYDFQSPGCETWPVTQSKEQTLNVYENEVLTCKFGHKKDEVIKEWRNDTMVSFILYLVFLVWLKQEG